MTIITGTKVMNFCLVVSAVMIIGDLCLGLLGYIDNVDYKLDWTLLTFLGMIWLSVVFSNN